MTWIIGSSEAVFYYAQAREVISEYDNPMETISRVIGGMHSDKSFYSHRSSEYKYTLRLGMIEKSEQAVRVRNGLT